MQSKTVYYPCEEVYEYKPRGLEETEYPEYPYPEVIGYVNNDDGTLTLKVQAVFPYRGVSKAYIHEVTVRDTKDGGIRNEYTQISELARTSGEPIFITNKGEDDGVFMSMAAFEEREKMFRHRDAIYAAEMSRLSGEPTLTPEQFHARMEALFDAYEG